MTTGEIPPPTVAHAGQAEDRGLSMFRPIRVRKVADEVIFVITNAIRGGVYHPGDRLPRERELAERLEVSPTTIREAIGVLERAGIVSVRRGNNGGVFVRTRFIAPSVLEAIEGESFVNLRVLLQARRVLETSCSVLAARNATEADFADLEQLLELLAELTEKGEAADEIVAVDLQWHLRVGVASHNPTLAGFLDEVLRTLGALGRQLPAAHIRLLDGVSNQRHTLAALRSGDTALIEASVDHHLGSLEEHLLGTRLAPAPAIGSS